MLALVQRVDVPLITLMPHEGTWLSYVEKHSAKWNHMQAEPAKFVWLLRLHCCHRDILSFSFCLSSHCCNKLGIICVSTHLWKFELFGMCIPIMESWLGERGQSCCQCQIFFQASHVYNHHMQLTYSFFFLFDNLDSIPIQRMCGTGCGFECSNNTEIRFFFSFSFFSPQRFLWHLNNIQHGPLKGPKWQQVPVVGLMV